MKQNWILAIIAVVIVIIIGGSIWLKKFSDEAFISSLIRDLPVVQQKQPYNPQVFKSVLEYRIYSLKK